MPRVDVKLTEEQLSYLYHRIKSRPLSIKEITDSFDKERIDITNINMEAELENLLYLDLVCREGNGWIATNRLFNELSNQGILLR